MTPFHFRRNATIIIHADEKRQIISALNWAEKRKYNIIISGGRDAWKRCGKTCLSNNVPCHFPTCFHLLRTQANLPFDTHFRAPGILAKCRRRTFHPDSDLGHGLLPISETSRTMQPTSIPLGFAKEKMLWQRLRLILQNSWESMNHLGTLGKRKGCYLHYALWRYI